MKKILLSLIVMTITLTAYADSELHFELSVGREAITQYEPIPIVLTWENNSKSELKLGFELTPDQSPHVTIYVDGSPGLKLPSQPVLITHTRADKISLSPEEKKVGGISIDSLNLLPGIKYLIKAIADFSDNPEGFFRGTVESNSLSVTVNYPKNQDRVAFLDAENSVTKLKPDLNDREKKIAICAELQSDRIMSANPDSIYAAWQLAMFHLDRVDKRDPIKLVALIRQKGFPEERSVPIQSNSAQVRSLKGTALAKWEYDTALAIVTKHPDFPLADALRLNAAANALVLGDTRESLRLLKEVSQKAHADASNWANSFEHVLSE
jgi:hypothetical protein